MTKMMCLPRHRSSPTWTVIAGIAFAASIVGSAGQDVEQCPDEAAALEECAALNAGVTEILASCLTCVTDDSIPAIAGNGTAAINCTSFQDEFCANLDRNCNEGCDEGPCGDPFRDFFHCIAEAAAENACDVECDGIDGNTDTFIGGQDDGEGGGDPQFGNTPPEEGNGSSNGTDTGTVPEFVSSGCQSMGRDLQQCLEGNGRSGESVSACLSCIVGSNPASSSSSGEADCSNLEVQFCSSIQNCETSCATSVCGDAFEQTYSCELHGTGCADAHCVSSSSSLAAAPTGWGPLICASATAAAYGLTYWFL